MSTKVKLDVKAKFGDNESKEFETIEEAKEFCKTQENCGVYIIMGG